MKTKNIRTIRRPAFDPAGPFVARRVLLIGGDWYPAGAPVPTRVLKPGVARTMYSMRELDLDPAHPSRRPEIVGNASGPCSDASREESALPLPGLPDSKPPRETADTDAEDGQAAAAGDGGTPSPTSSPALPEGWRELHGAKLKSLAMKHTGAYPPTKAEAVAILAGLADDARVA